MIAKVRYEMGVREKDTRIETDRGGLIGMYIGEAALKATGVLEGAKGGTLFIDEAYTHY